MWSSASRHWVLGIQCRVTVYIKLRIIILQNIMGLHLKNTRLSIPYYIVLLPFPLLTGCISEFYEEKIPLLLVH